MNAAPAFKRPLSDMPCDPDRIQLDYELKAALSSEDVLEMWRLVAHVGEDSPGLEHIPPCKQCIARWNRIEEQAGYVEEDAECVHRLRVGEFELVRVRCDGSQSPFWALEEASQSLYEIAQTIFNAEGNGFTEDFQEIAEWGGDDVLVLDRAEIVEAWRGFGLGPMIAADAIHRLAPGCSAVLVHPAPADARSMNDDQREEACGRLRKTWATLGFVPYGDTPYMIFATCWADPEAKQYALRRASRELSAAWRLARREG